MTFSKAFLNMAFSTTLILQTCFGLNLIRGLNETNAFVSKPSFTQRAVLHKSRRMHKHTVIHKNPSCWACAKAVCGLQDSSFHGGRRNTSKAVKYPEMMAISMDKLMVKPGI
jgi:hypothetical protein